MNHTYHVGDTVQILSKQEVLSHPMDNSGNYIIDFRPNGVNDSFHKDKLEICGTCL